MEITPEKLQEWISVFWSIGWKGLLVFAVVYYRDLVTSVIKTFLDILASWLKRK